MKSTTGTTNTKKVLKSSCACAEKEKDLHDFSTEDICRIIDTCGKSMVKEFSCRDLHISFLAQSEANYEERSTVIEQRSIQPNVIGAQISPSSREILNDFHDAQKLISDPSSFESDILDGKIPGYMNGPEEAYD